MPKRVDDESRAYTKIAPQILAWPLARDIDGHQKAARQPASDFITNDVAMPTAADPEPTTADLVATSSGMGRRPRRHALRWMRPVRKR